MIKYHKADLNFKYNMKQILNEGYLDVDPRPKYEDGTPAHTKYITQVLERYDLSKGEFPITTLRPINVMNAIKEIFWIYHDESNDLGLLEEKYGIRWWRPWEVENNHIGKRYGETVRIHNIIRKLLSNLTNDPFGRRHIISLWQESDFDTSAGLNPCAFLSMYTVRQVGDVRYLDATLTIRSSDSLVAFHINCMQYVALQMMLAKHSNMQVGNFVVFVQNYHVYDRHEEQMNELLSRPVAVFTNEDEMPRLVLDVPDGTNFYDIKWTDFRMENYNPILPQLKFELGI